MLLFVFIDCCLFGTLMWFMEQGTWYPPESFELIELNITGRGAHLRHLGTKDFADFDESPFISIVHSFWYVIVTITTVGYGDIWPTTPGGKAIGSFAIMNGVILLAMPIGLVGANFSNEYYKVLEDQKRRAKLKQQLDTLKDVEFDEDELDNNDGMDSGADCSLNLKPEIASKVNGLNSLRQMVLCDAEKLDVDLQAILHPCVHKELCGFLRQFLGELLCAELVHGTCDSGNSDPHKQMISHRSMTDLDALADRIRVALGCAVSPDELADFGIADIFKLRQQLATFEDRCWKYITTYDCLEPPPEPPEYDMMKPHLAHQSG